MNFLRRLALQKQKNLMTARVSMLLKSRAALTCFRACFLPGWAKDLSAQEYIVCIWFVFFRRRLIPIGCSLTRPDPNHEPLKRNIFISVFNQLDAQNLFHNKFYFMPLHVSSTCTHHQEVKIALHSLWYHHTYRCDDTIGCVMQF